jgi:3-phosphoshikimate 1-carboxyvinyltransferase
LIAALRALGVPIAEVADGVHVAGVGLTGLSLPRGALDAADSPTSLELLAALLAGQKFGTRIEARGIALRHSLRTLLPPLRARGAQIAGRNGEDGALTAPVAVAPLLADEQLAPVEIEIPNGDPSTKRGLLISGLYARGITALNEGLLSRDHTERALLALGAPLQTLGPLTLLDTSEAPPRWGGFHWHIPGDFSLAAYVIAAALAIPGSDVVIEGVGLNRSRTAFLDALRHAGADIVLTPKGDCAGDEPVGEIRVRASRLRGIKVMGELAQRLLDDVPAYAALIAASGARIALRDAGSLRLWAGDPLKQCAQQLRAFGADCTDYEDGFDVQLRASSSDRPATLNAATLPADVAPSVQLLGLVLGLCAEGETRLLHADGLDALYPGLRQALQSLGANIEHEEAAKEV